METLPTPIIDHILNYLSFDNLIIVKKAYGQKHVGILAHFIIVQRIVDARIFFGEHVCLACYANNWNIGERLAKCKIHEGH